MRILKSGIASIQDLGRFGYRNSGIHNSGCLDESASWLANMLVDNEPGAALIEISGGEFSCTSSQSLLLAAGGRGYHLAIDNHTALSIWQPFLLQPGEQLTIRPETGGILYLAVHGGIRCPVVLDSRSTHLQAGFGGHEGRRLRSRDQLMVSVLRSPLAEKICSHLERRQSHPRLSPQAIADYSRNVIRYFEAHEYPSFSTHTQLLIETAAFRLSAQSGRMAYRFRGSPLYQENPLQLVSTAVVPGTMQVTPDGQLMILMADAQTTGGYPRIGQVCRVDLSLLAQQLPGTSLHFRKVSVEEAERLYLNRQKQLIALRKDYQLFFR